MSDDAAFPFQHHEPDGSTWSADGMTLRDYFAAKAMQSLISKVPLTQTGDLRHEELPPRVSVGAYEYADAMMKARDA